MNSNELIHNCNAHTPEELAPYEEHYVAWSEDGKHILAHARELKDLYKEIDRQGITRYVIGFIPDPDLFFLGGASLDI